MRRGILLGIGVLLMFLTVAVACGRQPAAPPPTPTPRVVAPTPAPATPTPTAAPAPAPAPAPDVEKGKQVFIAKGCGACHTIQGVQGAVGQVGPELTRIGTVAATRKPGISAEEYIRESIENPNAFVVEGFQPVMPQLRPQMTDEEFEALVQFLLSQK